MASWATGNGWNVKVTSAFPVHPSGVVTFTYTFPGAEINAEGFVISFVPAFKSAKVRKYFLVIPGTADT